MDNYAGMVGRMPAIVGWFQEWGYQPAAWSDFATTCMNAVVARGAMPMVTWAPCSDNLGDPAYKLTNITDGNFDTYIRNYAVAAKAWGHPFLLRFAHEMNGNWNPWGTGPNNPLGNSASDFVSAWKHVHDIFTPVGATNALWVWSPNTLSPNSPDMAADYPGDAYVDWVGLDGYNVGTSEGWNGWNSLLSIFQESYNVMSSFSAKPMMIAETASTEMGGDKAAWITQAFLTDIPAHLPRVSAVMWFNMDKETDWRVNSSASSLAAFSSVAASAQYQGHI